MTTGPLDPADGWESARQILFRIRRYSFLSRVKLLQSNEVLNMIEMATLVISVLTTPGSISWINTPVPSSSKASD